MKTRKSPAGRDPHRPAPVDGRLEGGRFSSQRKARAVLRLLRGEDLDKLSRELGVTAARLSQWRDRFLAGGSDHLQDRPPDERDEEIVRLRAKIGDLTMQNELLLERAHKAEAGLPLGFRRPRR